MSSTLTDPSVTVGLGRSCTRLAVDLGVAGVGERLGLGGREVGGGVAGLGGSLTGLGRCGVRDEGQPGRARIERLDLRLRDRRGDVGQVGRIGHASRPWWRCGSDLPRPAGAGRTRPSGLRSRRRSRRPAGRAPRRRGRAASISPSRAVLRVAMRASVSSRIRAISPFDHSRTAATSSSARRRRLAPSSVEAAWISSTTVLASADRRAIVSSRELSAAACIARLRSAMNFVGRRAAAVAGAFMSIMSGVTSSSTGFWSLASGAEAGATSAGGSVSVRSAPQGSLKPGRVSVCAIGSASSIGEHRGPPDIHDLGASWQRGSVRCSWLVVPVGSRRWYRRALLPFRATMASMDATRARRSRPRTDRHARSGDARSADLGHRSVQLPVHLLHAQGDLRAGLRVPAEGPGPELRGDRADRPDLRGARRRQAPDHRWRAARPARPARPDRDAGGHPPAGRGRGRPDPDDERVRAAGAGRRRSRQPACSG